MAAALTRSLASENVVVLSGGSAPASSVNPMALAAMEELGISLADEQPKKWTMEMLHEVDVVVTMGCGDTCPFIPGKRYVDWPLDDPAGQGVDAVRPIRDQIKTLVEALLSELAVR